MSKELRILLLEDVAEEAHLVERIIRKANQELNCKRVESRDEFIKALDDFRPNLVLSDHSLPQFNSIEALRLTRSYDPAMPFILVTGAVSEEFAVSCLKQGATDYVLKSNLSRLPSAITQALKQYEANRKKKEAETELRRQSMKLRLSNEELMKRNHELDSFVYSVSHNLRGPLSSILGLVNLSRPPFNENPAELFDKIEASVKVLDETLKKIVNYSRNARNAVEFSTVDVHAVYEETCNRLSEIAAVRKFKFQRDPRPLQPILTDPERLNLIMHNLVSNALMYIDEAKSEHYLFMGSSLAEGQLTLTFEDNGVGVSPDVLPNIFKMFYRADLRSNGAGLGLYLVKEAVQRLGGTIEAESAPGAGTRFTIVLPIEEMH